MIFLYKNIANRCFHKNALKIFFFYRNEVKIKKKKIIQENFFFD